MRVRAFLLSTFLSVLSGCTYSSAVESALKACHEACAPKGVKSCSMNTVTGAP